MPDFTGEFGGLMAGAFITGVSLGWTLCTKILLGPERNRASKIEAKLDEMRDKIEAAFWQR